MIHGKLAKKSELESQLCEVFSSEFSIDFRFTTSEKSASYWANEILKSNLSAIIAVGGDGTLSEVVDSVMKSGKNGEVMVGLLPKGSGNDFARTMDISFDLEALKSALLSKSVVETDVLKISNTVGNSVHLRYCINIADVGIGGEVANYLHGKKKLFGADITYIWATIRAFFTYKKQEMKLVSPNFEWEGKALGICMANGKYFGSGLGIAPEASVNDGEIEIVVLGGISLWDYFLQIGNVKKCIPLNHRHVYYSRAKSIQIIASEQTFLDVDGEFNGSGTLTCEILPSVVRFLKS